MVALESNLLVWLIVIFGMGALLTALWRPVLRRAWRYLQAWSERDATQAWLAIAERVAREQAEAEVSECLLNDIPLPTSPVAPASPARTNGKPETQPAPQMTTRQGNQ